ncbi:MAG: serine hydrolase, partial [Anaerolineales bacterium]|nr:serine hydrolase [Anaerolineales bacterium]
VVGYLVEVLSGKPLAVFLQEKIFDPLGMVDTAFHIDPSKLSRFCTLYGKTPDSDFGILDMPDSSEYLPPVAMHSGGSGLVSTTADYLKFTQCILNKGELNGVRLLGPKTVALMTSNHLPAALLPIAFEGTEPMLGMGFGLGFGVMLDTAQTGVMGSEGDHGWGGYAETFFWIDPKEDLIAILMTQYLPSQTYPIRKEFRTTVYQAMLD